MIYLKYASRKKADEPLAVNQSMPENSQRKGTSLSIYHFNLQYNAGNLKSYHVLITKSFVPFLDFYLKYPVFKASCEIQGHAIAFMARFYPDELEKLRKLVMDRKNIDLVSVHYSDQVYLAYPRRDLEQSMRVNDEVLEKYGLRRGGTFFAQENFFGPGAIPVMKQNGYSVALLNRHYLRHYQGELPSVPYYERDGVFFLVGGGFTARDKERARASGGQAYDDVPELVFDYWGDGELAFTQGNNYFPFHGPSEKKRLKRLALYIDRHKNGYITDSCTSHVERLQEMGVKPEPLPLLLDGSWNYPTYGGVYLWMGRYRLPWERDGYVRSHTFRTRAKILATEALLSHVKGVPRHVSKKLGIAWKHLLLAEVSDSTGQTPVITEVRYSFNESNLAREYAREVVEFTKSNLGLGAKTRVLVDCSAKTYETLDQAALVHHLKGLDGESSSLDSLRDDIPAFNPTTWNMKRACFSIRKAVGTRAPTEYYLDIEFKGRPTRLLSRVLGIARTNNNFTYHEKFDAHFSNYVGFTVPLAGRAITFCPALMEDAPVEVRLDDLKTDETIGKTFLPLPNGLLGIGDDTYIVKHNLHGNTHIAATIDIKRGTVGFIQDGPPSDLTSNWKFSIMKSTLETALHRANELNVFPKVLL